MGHGWVGGLPEEGEGEEVVLWRERRRGRTSLRLWGDWSLRSMRATTDMGWTS